MPGLKIIEVVLGLVFVYLLVSLLCTAINEYISGILNKRGKELFKAVDDLLGDEDVRNAFYGHPLITTLSPQHAQIRNRTREIQERQYGTRWAHRLVGWLQPTLRGQRLPSYLPARNFALALLNSTDYAAVRLGVPGAPFAGIGSPDDGSPPHGASSAVETPESLARLFDALLQESAADVSELLRDPAVASILASGTVPGTVLAALTGVTTGAKLEGQKLQDAVELWFNNAMDRVSGSYKRYTQIALLLIGLVVSILLNIDTIRIWNTLSTNDQLRAALVQRAIAFNEAARRDTARAGSTPADTTHAPAPALAPPPPPAPAPPSAPAPPAAGTLPNPAISISGDSTPAGTDTTKADATKTPKPQITAAAADSACLIVTGDTAQKAVARAVAGQRLTCREARTVMMIAKAQLDSTQLALGWSRAELLSVGVVKEVPVKPDTSTRDSATRRANLQRAATAAAGDTMTRRSAPPAAKTKLSVVLNPFRWHKAIWPKLLGLILTAIAVSLGAPFWFDILNKIINIRSAGRAPDERAKSPEATDKRIGRLPPM